MSWKETCAMTERVKFIAELERGERTMTEVCRLAGISRKTGYKWWNRYGEFGLDGLKERSRAPLTHPNAVAAEMAALLIETKSRYPNWGPEKVLDYLAQHEPRRRLPAVSTAGELFKRHGLVKPRRSRRRSPPYSEPFVAMSEPNAVWSADFKGQFRTGDRQLCYPLTISDGFSRYLIACRGLCAPEGIAVRYWMERAFREYGLPWAIRTDNGAPFASTALGGLSRLAVWWIKLGIRPERIAKGHPEQNGRHERLHWTLKQDTALPPRASLGAQQRAFDRFRVQYNQERPHEALAKRTPSELYSVSARAYPRRLPEIEYPAGFQVRRVRHSGQIKWRSQFVYLSQVLVGEPVGLYQIDERCWRLYYGPVAIGLLDEQRLRIEPLTANDLLCT